MRIFSTWAAALLTGIAASLSGCAAVRPGAELARRVAVERLDPGRALEILDASPRRYVIGPGRLRADSLVQPYVGQRPVEAQELGPGAAEVWNEAATALYLGNFARAAELFSALVRAVPRCAECRVERARALLGMAAMPGQDADGAERLRRQAADELRIASALDPDIPVGRGIFTPPVWIGRNDIRLWPEGDAAKALFSEGNDAYNSGDLDSARRAYTHLLVTEPRFGRGYLAIGDTYFDEANYSAATRWYAAALAADSTDYLAWRSLARAYAAMGLMQEAKDAAIRAVIYNYHDGDSWRTLKSIGRALGFSVTRRRVDKRVEVAKMPDGTVHIVVDSVLSLPGQIAWLGYAAVRAVWRYEGRFRARYPRMTVYRPTFEEHMEAIAALVAVWEGRDTTVSDGQLDMLSKIAQAGYLGEYVAFEELAADSPDAMAHLSAEALTRIKEYILRFVIGGLPL